MAEFDALADIGGGDFVERTLEADGGIVIDHPFVADEEDLIEFGPGQPSDENPTHGGVITVDGSLVDTGVELMVIILVEPEAEGFIEFVPGQALLESR